MKIAEKVLQLKQDFDDVHNKGYEEGKNSVVDYSQYANVIQFYSLNDFGKNKVELNLPKADTLDGLFSETTDERLNTTVDHLIINSTSPINLNTMLNTAKLYDTTLKRVTLNFDMSNITTYYQAFRGRKALEIVDGNPLDFSSVTIVKNQQQIFYNCTSIVEFRVVPNSLSLAFDVGQSPNLSPDTIQSIIDGLADLTGGTAQTLTLHSTVGAKLTEEQKATITAKNWELVY